MSSMRKEKAYGSPMDEVFAWETPRDSQKESEMVFKRKYDDSGYTSCSSGSKSSSDTIVNTPIDSKMDYMKNEIYTPYIKQSPQGVKKRIFDKTEDKCSNYNFTLPVMDSFSDFLIDASLYTEPMEVSDAESALCMINEESDSVLGVTEISKKIDVNLEIDNCSSLKIKVNSPKRKSRTPTKKKCSRQRSLVGFENIDMLFQLGERRNYSIIVSKILSYLTDSDLYNVTMVSSTWRNICLKDPKARSRWFKHKEYLKERKENSVLKGKKLKRSQGPLLSNRNYTTPLHENQPKSPPVSPSKFRFHLFQKEARNLKENEALMECPRCSRPSACSPSTLIGECRGIACMHKFCTVCRAPVHDPSPCPFFTPVTPTKKTRPTIGSKESRRFLRRL